MSDAPPPAPPDLLQLVSAFARLVEVLSRARRPGSEGPVQAAPRADGALVVRFPPAAEGRPGPVLELLPAPPPGGDCPAAGPFGWAAAAGDDAPGLDEAHDALEAACDRLARDPRFVPLHVANTGLSILALDGSTVDRILARRLDTGRSRVAGWRFTGADEEPGRAYRLSFRHERDDRVATLALCTAEAADQATFAGLGPFRLGVRLASPGQPPRDLLSEDEAAGLDPPARAVVEAGRFLLSRSLPPGLALASPGWRADNAAARPDDSPVQTSTWNQHTAWRRFFVPFEAERDLMREFASRDAWGRTLFFMHGEPECDYIQPQGVHRATYHRALRPARPGRSLADEPEAVREVLRTRLGLEPPAPPARPAEGEGDGPADGSETRPVVLMGEREVIFGATEQLEESLARQRALARPGDLFIFNETCVAKLMGEDLQRVKRDHLARGGAPILELNIQLPGPVEMMQDFVCQMRDLVLSGTSVEGAGGVVPDGVALVGYPEDGSLPELAALLKGLGLRLTTAFLPGLGRESLMDALRSRYLICHPGEAWVRTAREILAGPHTEVVVPPLPYGFAGTLRFLDHLAEATGRGNLARERRPALQEAFEALRHPVPAGLGVGYVVDAGELRDLARADRIFGVPAMAFLEELGFGQAILLHVPASRPASADERALVEGALRDPGAAALRTFADAAELQAALGDLPGTQAVWSQLTFDGRLYACGKAAFSLADLECGPWGALRTARRLAARCRWAGPRRLGPHLREPGWNA